MAQRLAVAPTRILYTVRSHTAHLRPEDGDVNPRLPRLEPCPDYGANRMASFSNCGYAAIISSLPADFGAPSRTTYTSRPLTHTNGAEWGNSRSGLCGHRSLRARYPLGVVINRPWVWP